MKAKNNVIVLFVVAILVACAPTSATVLPTENMVSTIIAAPPTEITAPTSYFTPVPPTATPTVPPTTTPEPPLETLPLTQMSARQFVSAMQAAGINLSVEQMLAQGLEIKAVSGADGRQYEIAVTRLDPDPNQQGEELEGSYPIMIKIEQGWEEATLKNVAHLSGMKFGAFLNLNKDFHSFTIDNFETGNAYIDWNLVQAQKGVWDFSDPGYNIETAHANGMTIMANLIWARNVADWAKQEPDLHAIMVDYITQVMTHYGKMVGSWNVYNEAQRIRDEEDVFWSKLGLQGVRDAYATARMVDPEATLLYCDFIDLEGYAGVHNPPIIDTIVSQLQQDGTLDGISFQVTGRMQRLDMAKLRTAMDFLQGLNLPIHVSEFSVIIEGDNTPENLIEQAKVGADVIRILKEYNVVEIIAFGLEDRLTNNIYRMENANAGLWLKTDSGEYVPKPIVYTMMAVFIEP